MEAATATALEGIEMRTTTERSVTIAGLKPHTAYYWRVDTVTAESGAVTGPVWAFTAAATYGGRTALRASSSCVE